MARRPKSNIPRYKRRRTSKRSPFGRIVGFIVKLVLVFVIGSVLWVLAYRFVNPPITATMLGDRIGGRSVSRDWMGLERIDRDAVRAAIAAEDSKFCRHSGFDMEAIENAMKRNASGGRIRGGSTISQQTAKNAFLWQGGGYFRKGLEAWFTLLIETLWSKRRIMEVYLNVAETGIGTYGVDAGAQRYFRHDASSLSAAEAARIAAVFPLPKRREAVAPTGFTRRYGNMISARIGVVRRDRLDACVYESGLAPADRPEPASRPETPRPTPSAPPPQAAPSELPGEEFERSEPEAEPAPINPEPMDPAEPAEPAEPPQPARA